MPIRFRCQDCSSRVKVPEGTQGKQVKCPRCGRIQSVPNRQDNAANSDLTVHTLVGSIHKAPKRKEALVTSPAAANGDSDRFDAYDSGDAGDPGDSGGGVPGGLNIPTEVANEDYDSGQDHKTRNPGDSGHHNYRGNHTMSRKKRRRLEAKAARVRRDAARAENQARIDASRKQVEDIFAGSKYDTRTKAVEESTPVTQPAARTEPIALSGSDSLDAQIETVLNKAPMADVPEDYADPQAAPASVHAQAHEQTHTEPAAPWTLDLTAEAYPFLKVVPWVLRVAALMLIGLAFKAMLVASDMGLSAVVCMLVLFAGLTMVAVTWTVGEIATAVRDIAMRKSAA